MTFKRVIAQYAVRSAVMTVTSTVVERTATDIIQPEEDSCAPAAIELGSAVVGFAVSRRLGPYTDKMVDRVADWRASRKTVEATTE